MSPNPFVSKPKLAIFVGYYKPHLRLFLMDMGCAFIISLIDLSFPLLSRYSLNTLIPQKAWGLFAILVGAVAAAFVLRGFLHYIVTYWGHLLG
ncbi:MAG TPA: thiamine ABC transporter permease, partial [Spirochaetaceae bacterium]|nr:thiamine ABC transporter permease [Spirochaetaceae bacterium]